MDGAGDGEIDEVASSRPTHTDTEFSGYEEEPDEDDALWEVKVDERFGESSPTVVDGMVYAVDYNGTVHALDKDTGDTEWTAHRESHQVDDSPTVVDDVLYVTSGESPGATSAYKLHAIDVEHGEELWNASLDRRPAGSSVYGDTVYVSTGGDWDVNNGYLLAFDADTGEKRWSYESMREATGEPTVTDGTVYFGDGVGNLYALDADDGDEDWTFDGEGAIQGSPTVADDRVYVPIVEPIGGEWGDPEDEVEFRASVFALDPSDGESLWDEPFDDTTVVDAQSQGETSSLTVDDGTLYFGASDGSVYAVDASDGTVVWTAETGARVQSSPTIAEGVVYVGSDDGHVYAINTDDGDVIWAYDAGDWVRSSPTVTDGIVYVGADNYDPDQQDGSELYNATLYALDAGVDGSSADSRIELATLGHNERLQPYLTVEVESTNAPVLEGETLEVEAIVSNSGQTETGTVELEGFDGEVVDSREVTVERGEAQVVTLDLETGEGDAEYGEVTVRSPDDADDERVAIQQEADITGCEVIDTPGVYTQTGGQSSSATCIEITSSYVELDGRGIVLAGGFGMDAGAHGVHVYGDGEQLTNVVIENVDLQGWASGPVDNAGIRLENVSDSEISGVNVDGSYFGIWGEDVSDTTIKENDLTGNTVWGIDLQSSSRNEIVDNDITQPYYGLYLWGGSDDNVIDGNEISGNNFGILLDESSENEVIDTVARHNRGDVQAPDDRADYFSSQGATNTVENVTLSNPSDVDVAFDDALVEDGTVYASGEVDADLEVTPHPDVRASFVAHNADLEASGAPAENPDATSLGQYIQIGHQGSNAYVDLEVHYDEEHLDGADESTLSLWHYDEGWTELDDASVDTDRNVVAANVTEVGTVGVFLDDPSGEHDPAVPVTEDVESLSLIVHEPDSETNHEVDAVHEDGTDWTATIELDELPDGEVYELWTDVGDVHGGLYSLHVEEDLYHSYVEIGSATTGDVGQSVSFWELESSIPEIDEYHWDFGDGSTVTTEGSVVSHTYDEPGEFVVTVTVENSLGNPVSATRTVTIAETILQATVTDGSGDPIENATVGVHEEGSSETNSSGVVEFTVSAGTYTVYASYQGAFEYRESVEVTRGETAAVELVLEVPGTITGTVTDADTAEPIGDAGVLLADNETGDPVDQTTTDTDGAYEFDTLEEGTYDLVVNADEYEADVVQGVHVDEGEELSVDVELESLDVLVEITETNEPVIEGETLVVNATVTNAGSETPSETVELRDVDDEVLATETVDLEAGESETVTLEWETDGDDVGTHVLRVEAATDADNVEVAVEAFTPAAFENSIDATNSPVTANETFVVEATVENVGDEAGTETVELRNATDDVVASETVDLEAGESESVTLEWETGPDDVGQSHFAVVTGDDAETVPVAVDADDLGIEFWPSKPEPHETVFFHAANADDPTWEFGDGTTAQGSFVFHEFEWPWGTRSVTVTDVDGTEEQFDVPVSMPTFEWNPQPMASTSIDREYGGVPLSGVEWEETFTARLVSVDTVGAEAVDVEEFVFELGDETVTKTPTTDGFAQEAEATFDLGELDGDEELTVTAVTEDGGEWEMTEMVSVTETPEWLEDAFDLYGAEVDQEAGEIATEFDLGDLAGGEEFSLDDLPLDTGEQSVGGATSAVVVYDATTAMAVVEGEGGFDADVLDVSIEAGAEVEATIDAQLDLQQAWLAAHADVEGIPGPFMGLNAPVVGEVGIGTEIDLGLAAEGDFDGDFVFEQGTVQPGAGLTVYTTVNVGCEVYVYASGELVVAIDFGPAVDDANLRGEATIGGGGGLDCGFLYEGSLDLEHTMEFGDGIDGTALALALDEDDVEWELAGKYGERPFSGDDEPADGVERLTDRDLEDTQPAIVADGEDLVVVWSAQSEEKDVADGRDLHYQRYDATDEEWSETERLTDDATSDERPALAATDDGAVVAVWSTVDESVDPDSIDGPAELFPRYEIAYAIDDGDGWSESEVLTDTDEIQTAPSAVATDGGWLLAWESVELVDETVTGGDVRYATVDADGEVGEIETIENATLPALGLDADGETPTLAYATLDGGPTADASAGESRTAEVVTERIDAGDERDELHAHPAGNVTSLATGDGRSIWTDGVLGPALYDGDADGVTELELREDVYDVSEPSLATAGEDTVLSYRARTAGESAHDLVYRLDRGDGWIHDREHVTVGEANHTAWHADVISAADGEGFHAAYAVQKLEADAVNDVFVADHEFRPAFDLSATASEADAGEDATIAYDLRNVGDVATSADVTLVVENGTGIVAERDLGSLEAGTNVTGEIDLTVDDTGTFDLWIDHDEQVHDGVEAATVVAATPALSVESVSSERTDDGVAVTAAVRNDGGAAATTVTLGFDNGTGTVAESSTTETLHPGQNATVTADLVAADLNQGVVDRVRIDVATVGPAAVADAERVAWFAQPDLDVGTVEYLEADDGTVIAEVLIANRGTGSADATVRVADENGAMLGESDVSIANATAASPTFEPVTVDLGDVESGTAVTITADADVPDADPSTAGMTDTVGPVFDPDREPFHVTIDDVDAPGTAGEELTVDVTIENRGEAPDEQPIVLSVDGVEVDAVDVELEPGFRTTETLTYAVTADDGLSVDLLVESRTAADATAAFGAGMPDDDGGPPSPSPDPAPSPDPDDPAAFVLGDLEIPTPVAANESLIATVSVENVGEDAGTTTVELRLDGRTLDAADVSLEGGDATTVELVAAADDLPVGEHTLRVTAGDHDESATVRVTDQDADEATDDASTADDADDSVPGFGPVVALGAIAILLGALATRRPPR